MCVVGSECLLLVRGGDSLLRVCVLEERGASRTSRIRPPSLQSNFSSFPLVRSSGGVAS